MSASERPKSDPNINEVKEIKRVNGKKPDALVEDNCSDVGDNCSEVAEVVDLCLRQPPRIRRPDEIAKPVGKKHVAKGTVKKAKVRRPGKKNSVPKKKPFYIALVDKKGKVIISNEDVRGIVNSIRDLAAVTSSIELVEE